MKILLVIIVLMLSGELKSEGEINLPNLSATYKTVSTIQGDIASVTYEIKLLNGDNNSTYLLTIMGGHPISAPYKKVFDWHLRLKKDSNQ